MCVGQRINSFFLTLFEKNTLFLVQSQALPRWTNILGEFLSKVLLEVNLVKLWKLKSNINEISNVKKKLKFVI